MVSCLTQNKAYGCLHWELMKSKSASYQQIKACRESWVVNKSFRAALKKTPEILMIAYALAGAQVANGCVFHECYWETWRNSSNIQHWSAPSWKMQLFNAHIAYVLDLVLAKIHYTKIHRNSYVANFKWLIPWPLALTFIEAQMLTSSL